MDEKRKALRNFEKILKLFHENSIDKLDFYFLFILKKLLLKIKPSKITPLSNSNFFCFLGDSPCPLATPLLDKHYLHLKCLIRMTCQIDFLRKNPIKSLHEIVEFMPRNYHIDRQIWGQITIIPPHCKI